MMQHPNSAQGKPAVNMQILQFSSYQPPSIPNVSTSIYKPSNNGYYFPPNHETLLKNQKTTHIPQQVQNSPQYSRMSSTSVDEADFVTPQEHPLQAVRDAKKEKNRINKEADTVKQQIQHSRTTSTK